MKWLKRLSAVLLPITVVATYFYFQPTPVAQATAGPQIFYGRNTDATAISASRRLALNGAVTASSFATTTFNVFPIAGTFSNMTVTVDAAPGGVAAWTATLVEGASTLTAVTCTIPSGGVSCSDTTHSFAATPGKAYHIFVSATGVPAATYIRSSIQFVPSSTGHTALMGGGSPMSTTLERYGTPVVSGGWVAEAFGQNIFAEGGTLQSLYTETAAAPGAGSSYTFTLRDQNATTTVTAAVSGTAFTATDLVNNATVAASDVVDLASLPSTGTVPGSTGGSYGLDFIPTTAGDFLFESYSTNADNGATNRYFPIVGNTINVTEASTTVIAQAMTVTSMAVNVPTVPGAARTKTFTLRQNGSPTALTCAVTGGSAHICTINGSVAFAAGDTIDIEDAPSGAPATSAGISISLIANTNTGGTTPPDTSSAWFEVL